MEDAARLLVQSDGRVRDADEAACRLLGYSREEILSLHARAIDPAWTTECLQNRVLLARDSPGLRLESQLRRNDGTQISVETTWTSVPGERDEYDCGIALGVWSSKQVEAALNESRVRLKTIFDSVLAGVMIIDAETRQIADANPAALRLMGRPEEVVRGAVCHSFVCPADRARCPVVDLGQTVDNSERVLLTISGERIPILKSVVPVVLEGRRFLVENFVDIRQQKAVERELTLRVAELDLAREAAERQAKEIAVVRDVANEASRLKSAFLANMSHEIRTPMHAVLSMGELLSGTELSSEQREYVEGIVQSGRGLMCLLNDILDFSKIEAGKLELVRAGFNLQEEIDRLRMTLRPAAQAKGVELACEIRPGTPIHLVGDSDRLQQVLLNLAGNAVKFTDCGYVRVAAELDSQNGGTFTLRFSVEDTGVGMAPELPAHLFRPFVQGDGSSRRKHGGTGLGLAISRQLVDLMGGAIGVASEPGRGSTFWCTLPFGEGAAAQPLPAPGQREAARRDRTPAGRILVVEDNAINRKIATRMLEKLGYAADAVCSGNLAVTAVEDGNYTLVLMDVQMPEMDGFETTAEIRRREGDAHIPIIAMTANAMSGDRERCIVAGMDDYLSKPVQSAGMKAMIEKWTHRAEGNSSLWGEQLTAEARRAEESAEVRE